jgi:drug/metabolite transporter (DMT)-like permease
MVFRTLTNMHTSLFGIFAAISWAVADIFIAKSTRTIRPVLAAALVNLIGALFFAVYYALFMRHPVPPDLMGILWSSLAGFCIALASVFFFIALHKGPIGIVSALSSTYPAVTLALALSFFDAMINSRQILGFLMVIVGVVATAGLHSNSNPREPGEKSGTLTALMAALLWGIGYAFLAEGVSILGWEAASAVQFGVLAFCCLLFVALICIRNRQNAFLVKACLKNRFILGAAITQQTGAILLNIGLSSDSTGGSIIVALSACYPVLTAIMAFFVFRERILTAVLLAGALAIAGIVVLSL